MKKWVLIFHFFYGIGCSYCQEFIQYGKSTYNALYTYKNKNSTLRKKIENNLYILELSPVNSKSIYMCKFNFIDCSKTDRIINIGKYNYDGIIDFYIEDSIAYFLAGSGTRLIAFNFFENTELYTVDVKNPHSTLFNYSEVYVYNKGIFLIFNIDIAAKSTDKRNFFVDRLDIGSKKTSSVIKHKLNANVFSISSYKNYAFYKNLIYLSDIITGGVIQMDLYDSTNTEHLIFNNIFDIDSSKSNRVNSWEENNQGKTMLLIDSIRSFYENEISTTWITIDSGTVTILDKYPGDSCNAHFRIYEKDGKNTHSFFMIDSSGQCQDIHPTLNDIFYHKNYIVQATNYFEPKIGRSLKYIVYKRE